MSVLLIPFLWHAVGGISGFRAAVPHAELALRMVAPGEIGLFWIIMTCLNQLLGFVAQPHIMSNNAAGRTELDNRIGFTIGVTLKRLCSIGWALVGVLAIAYYGRGKIEPDHVFGSLIRDLLPTGFVGLMLSCVMASAMDVGSVIVLATSALFTRNLLRTFKRAGNQGFELHVGRIFSLLFIIATVATALSFHDVPSAIRFLWEVLPMIGIPFWLGLWWRRANRYGAVASFLSAITAWIVGLHIFGWRGDAGLPYLITFYTLVGVSVGVVVSLLTRPERPEDLDRFFLTINTPIGQEKKLRRFEKQLTGTPETII
jgi:Na+/proline symporter